MVDVVLAYNDHALIDAYRRRGDARKALAEAEENALRAAAALRAELGSAAGGAATDPLTFLSAEQEDEQDMWILKLQSIDAEIEQLRRALGPRRPVCAWVTFDRAEDRLSCLRAFAPKPLCDCCSARSALHAPKPFVPDPAVDGVASASAPSPAASSSSLSCCSEGGGGGEGGACGCAAAATGGIRFRGAAIHVMHAPEPSNILFDNLHFGERYGI